MSANFGGLRLEHFATEPLALNVFDKVKFRAYKQSWTVRAVTPRYVILTKPFNVQHTVLYTVIDWQTSRRGPDNYSGLGYETDEEIRDAAAMFASGEAELSVRHDVRLDIVSVNGVEVAS